MSRKLLVGGLAVLLVVLAALWWLLKKDDAQPAARRGEGSAVVVATDPGATPAPQLPGGGSAPALPAGSGEQNPRDYVVGDVRIRDHRAGDNTPMDIPPNVHPAESRRIPSALVSDIAQKVRGVLAECAPQIPREARGPNPKLEGQIIVTIKDKQLSVTQSTMQLRDVFGAALEPARQCVQEKSIGLTTSAGDEADLASYSIAVTFPVP